MSSSSLKPVLDYDFSDRTSLCLGSQNKIKSVSSLQSIDFDLSGIGHEPDFNQNEWGFKDNSAQFVNPGNWSTYADERLFHEDISSTTISDIFSITNAQWKPWSVFLVCQAQSSASYSCITGIFQNDQQTPWPKITLETSPTNFVFGVYNDGNHAGTISGVGGNLAAIDLNHHIIEISADGAGNINAWFDSVQVISGASDFRPKTCNYLSLASAWNNAPVGWSSPFTGLIAHVMIFDQNLSNADRTIVRDHLIKKHNV